jgi:hypothetical protein
LRAGRLGLHQRRPSVWPRRHLPRHDRGDSLIYRSTAPSTLGSSAPGPPALPRPRRSLRHGRLGRRVQPEAPAHTLPMRRSARWTVRRTASGPGSVARELVRFFKAAAVAQRAS